MDAIKKVILAHLLLFLQNIPHCLEVLMWPQGCNFFIKQLSVELIRILNNKVQNVSKEIGVWIFIATWVVFTKLFASSCMEVKKISILNLYEVNSSKLTQACTIDYLYQSSEGLLLYSLTISFLWQHVPDGPHYLLLKFIVHHSLEVIDGDSCKGENTVLILNFIGFPLIFVGLERSFIVWISSFKQKAVKIDEFFEILPLLDEAHD